MGYRTGKITQTVNIFKRRGGGKSRPVTLDSTAFTNGICKAGTPIDKDGKIANNGTVYGILRDDTEERYPQADALYAVRGSLDLALIESHTGLTIEQAVKDALPQIIFE